MMLFYCLSGTKKISPFNAWLLFNFWTGKKENRGRGEMFSRSKLWSERIKRLSRRILGRTKGSHLFIRTHILSRIVTVQEVILVYPCTHEWGELVPAYILTVPPFPQVPNIQLFREVFSSPSLLWPHNSDWVIQVHFRGALYPTHGFPQQETPVALKGALGAAMSSLSDSDQGTDQVASGVLGTGLDQGLELTGENRTIIVAEVLDTRAYRARVLTLMDTFPWAWITRCTPLQTNSLEPLEVSEAEWRSVCCQARGLALEGSEVFTRGSLVDVVLVCSQLLAE